MEWKVLFRTACILRDSLKSPVKPEFFLDLILQQYCFTCIYNCNNYVCLHIFSSNTQLRFFRYSLVVQSVTVSQTFQFIFDQTLDISIVNLHK